MDAERLRRMQAEHDELMEREHKLARFINSPEYGKLDTLEADLLVAQRMAMASYLMLLGMRIRHARRG